jgi:hypothetical protein
MSKKSRSGADIKQQLRLLIGLPSVPGKQERGENHQPALFSPLHRASNLILSHVVGLRFANPTYKLQTTNITNTLTPDIHAVLSAFSLFRMESIFTVRLHRRRRV